MQESRVAMAELLFTSETDDEYFAALRLRDTSTQKIVKEVKYTGYAPVLIEVSFDNKYMLMNSNHECYVMVIDLNTLSELARIPTDNSTRITGGFSPSGQYAIIRTRNELTLLSVANWAVIKRIKESGEDSTEPMSFSPSSTLVANIGVKGRVNIHSVPSLNLLVACADSSDVVANALFYTENRLIASYYDGKMRIWDTATSKQIVKKQAGSTTAMSLVLSPDRTKLASMSPFGANIIDPATLDVIKTIHFKFKGITVKFFTNDTIYYTDNNLNIATININTATVKKLVKVQNIFGVHLFMQKGLTSLYILFSLLTLPAASSEAEVIFLPEFPYHKGQLTLFFAYLSTHFLQPNRSKYFHWTELKKPLPQLIFQREKSPTKSCFVRVPDVLRYLSWEERTPLSQPTAIQWYWILRTLAYRRPYTLGQHDVQLSQRTG